MFSQDYKLNVRTCDGCACRCALGWQKAANAVFYPVINMQTIMTWIDVDGKYQAAFCRNESDALGLARKVVKVCDYYKTGVVPMSGSVKCMLCDLPDSEKCDMCWKPDSGDNSFRASVAGPHCHFGIDADGVVVKSKSVKAEMPGNALKELRRCIVQNCRKVNSH